MFEPFSSRGVNLIVALVAMNAFAGLILWLARGCKLKEGSIPIGVSLWVFAASFTWGEASTQAVDLMVLCCFSAGYALVLYGILDWNGLRGFSTTTWVVGSLVLLAAVIFGAFLSEDVLKTLSELVVPGMVLLLYVQRRIVEPNAQLRASVYFSILAVTGVVVHVWMDMQESMTAQAISLYMLQFIVLLAVEMISGHFSAEKIVNSGRRPPRRI